MNGKPVQTLPLLIPIRKNMLLFSFSDFLLSSASISDFFYLLTNKEQVTYYKLIDNACEITEAHGCIFFKIQRKNLYFVYGHSFTYLLCVFIDLYFMLKSFLILLSCESCGI